MESSNLEKNDCPAWRDIGGGGGVVQGRGREGGQNVALGGRGGPEFNQHLFSFPKFSFQDAPKPSEAFKMLEQRGSRGCRQEEEEEKPMLSDR